MFKRKFSGQYQFTGTRGGAFIKAGVFLGHLRYMKNKQCIITFELFLLVLFNNLNEHQDKNTCQIDWLVNICWPSFNGLNG